MISCRVNVENLAVNEDGTPSEIQPSDEHKSRMLQALSSILDRSQDRISEIRIHFLRMGKKENLDLVFRIVLDTPDKIVETRFSSMNGWIPSPVDMSNITLEAIEAKMK